MNAYDKAKAIEALINAAPSKRAKPAKRKAAPNECALAGADTGDGLLERKTYAQEKREERARRAAGIPSRRKATQPEGAPA